MASAIQLKHPSSVFLLRFILGTGAILGVLAISQFQEQLTAEGLIVTSTNFRAALYAGYGLVALLAIFAIASWTKMAPRILSGLARVQKAANGLQPATPFLFLVLLIAYPLIVLGFYGTFLTNLFPRLFLFLIFIVLGAVLFASWRRQSWLLALAVSALAFGAVYLAADFFNSVTDYPFSLEWSEISRYYQASFFFSERVYGTRLPLPVTHPSRYMLQSLPFLASETTLILHRAWQALLWVAMPLVTAWTLARRLRLKPALWVWSFVGWGFLYLMQGAVFYHLLPCVFIVLLAYDSKRPWQTFVFVAIASVWAGLSRINWVPLPGALAALLYFLEQAPRVRERVLSISYLWQPALFTIGGSLTALAAYWVYIQASGNPVEQFSSSFTSALLWERLWPNDAFPLGILPGVLAISSPLFIATWLRLQRKGEGLGLWPSLAIGALLVIFFAGGLVVSVKIGGGTNLHNMDAFMVLLWVLASVALFGSYSAEKRAASKRPLQVPASLITSAIAIPVLFAIVAGAPLRLAPANETDAVLAQIQAAADDALAAGTEVLFISQRHLLTFDMIHNVPLVPEYEKLFLMEMAISGNDAYLTDFEKDIDEQRFGLIVTDPLYNNITDTSQDTLAAENNAWVRSVGRVILCAYEPIATFSNPPVQLLVPRYGDKCNQ
jgi:hypothetical protein